MIDRINTTNNAAIRALLREPGVEEAVVVLVTNPAFLYNATSRKPGAWARASGLKMAQQRCCWKWPWTKGSAPLSNGVGGDSSRLCKGKCCNPSTSSTNSPANSSS
ncbi:hypothetical protein D3C80_1615840 [compost metagenome]